MSAHTLDYGFLELTSFSEVAKTPPQSGRPKQPEDAPGTGSGDRKHTHAGLRLNNNEFAAWDDFAHAVDEVVQDPQDLYWIDLSFNNFSTISAVLCNYRNVGSINLHANNISRLAEIDKLAALQRLKYLTLHGNPVETGAKSKLHYRNYIITKFPNLRKLDFTPITKQDRDTAKVWAKQRQAIRQRRRR